MRHLSELQARYPQIPDDILEGLFAWGAGEHPYRFGSFVNAVLENDLVQAAAYADQHNQRHLFTYASVLYNELPSGSWGSKAVVNNYLQQMLLAQEERIAQSTRSAVEEDHRGPSDV